VRILNSSELVSTCLGLSTIPEREHNTLLRITIEVNTGSALGELGICVQKDIDPADSRIINGCVVNVQEEHISGILKPTPLYPCAAQALLADS